MANRFEKGTWPDRQVQYPSRRRLTATAESDVWDVERVEGEIIEAGKAFGETNMKNLEDRIYNAFETLESSDVKLTDANNLFTATTVDGAFTELFQYAGNGKTAIATAIGSEASPSNTFPQLASTISNGKLQIANALGNAALQTQTFAYLANLIENEKKVFTQEISVHTTSPTKNVITQHIDVNFGFIPSNIYVSGIVVDYVGYIRLPVTFDSINKTDFFIDNITSSGFDIIFNGNLNKYILDSIPILYAIE